MRLPRGVESNDPLRVPSNPSDSLPSQQTNIRSVIGSKSQVTVQPRQKPPTFELPKRLPRKPSGLLDVYRQRRKLVAEIKRADATAKREPRVREEEREKQTASQNDNKTAGEKDKLVAAEQTTASV